MGIEDVDPEEPLPEAQAGKLVRYILANGEVVFTPHALQEMANDGRTEEDARNVLRAGRIFEPAEWEGGAWRYRIHTQRFCVVVEFDSVTMMVIVTFWEKKR